MIPQEGWVGETGWKCGSMRNLGVLGQLSQGEAEAYMDAWECTGNERRALTRPRRSVTPSRRVGPTRVNTTPVRSP